MKGEKLSIPGVTGSKKMFVITRRLWEKRESRIREAIQDNMVIAVPSPEVIDSMNEAYRRANRHEGKEQEFFVGKKGRVSMIVQGNRDSIGPAENTPARKDLAENKEDEPAYDVHTHGDSASADEKEFVWPSAGDLVPRNFRDRQQTSVILSYEQETYHEAVIQVSEGVGLKPPTRTARRITFYFRNIEPVKIPFSEFIKASQKIAGTD